MLFFYCRDGFDSNLACRLFRRDSGCVCQNIFCSHLSQKLVDQTLRKLLLIKNDSTGTFASMATKHGSVGVYLADLSYSFTQLCSFCYRIHCGNGKRGLS